MKEFEPDIRSNTLSRPANQSHQGFLGLRLCQLIMMPLKDEVTSDYHGEVSTHEKLYERKILERIDQGGAISYDYTRQDLAREYGQGFNRKLFTAAWETVQIYTSDLKYLQGVVETYWQNAQEYFG